MTDYTIWALGASQITVSGVDGNLSGFDQGDGSHLMGRTITLDSFNFEELSISDAGSDADFDDNDGNQRLDGAQSFDGVNYADNVVVEAEYRITLRDPDTGIEYDALGVNFRTTNPGYGTIEGLSFVDVIPPTGVALEVIDTFEGPGSSGQASIENDDIAEPACFTPGTLINTPDGPRPVEALRAGDAVQTRDNGAQPLIWVGRTLMSAHDLICRPHVRPILIRRDAFGPGKPCRDMHVSPQHRILISGPMAAVLYGESEVLAAAAHLVDDAFVLVDHTVRRVIYVHVQCATHEVLISDGLPTESYNPGTAQNVRDAQRGGAQVKFASRKMSPVSARPMIKRHEAALWRATGQNFPLASAQQLC